MAKRTNRVAWGLAVVLALVVLGGVAYREGGVAMQRGDGGREDGGQFWDAAQLQQAREAEYAVYEALGDHANAARLRLLYELQDRKRSAAFEPADFEQLLAMLQEPGLNTNVTTTIFLTLSAAGQRGQILSAYRERLRQTALASLGSVEYAMRQGGIVLLFVLNSREDRAAIAPFVDDPNEFVSKAAKDVLERWPE